MNTMVTEQLIKAINQYTDRMQEIKEKALDHPKDRASVIAYSALVALWAYSEGAVHDALKDLVDALAELV